MHMPPGLAEGVPPVAGEEEEQLYVPAKPACVPDSATASSITVFTSLPSGAPEPEEWEIEYGFRFHGGWRPAPWDGVVDESIPPVKGRGATWVCSVEGLDAGSKYIVRIRALIRTTDAAGHDVVGWSDWSETSIAIATLAAPSVAAGGGAVEPSAAASKLLSAAGAFLQESVTELKKRDVPANTEKLQSQGVAERARNVEDVKLGADCCERAQDSSFDFAAGNAVDTLDSASADEL